MWKPWLYVVFSFQPFYAKFAIFIHQLKPTLFLIFRHFIKFLNLSDLTELARAQPRHSPPSRFRIEISLFNTWIMRSDWLEIFRPISRTLTAYLFYTRKKIEDFFLKLEVINLLTNAIEPVKTRAQILVVRVLPLSNDFRHHWISTDLKTTNRGPRYDLALTVTWPLLIQSRKSERIS